MENRTLFVNMRKNGKNGWMGHEKWLDGTQTLEWGVHCGEQTLEWGVHCGEELLDQRSQKFEPLPIWLKFGT